MADIHGMPSEDMMVPVQAFESMPLPDFADAVSAAGADSDAGIVYPRSARQDEALAILQSPQGAGGSGQDVLSGSSVGWPVNIEPPDADMENPIQGKGTYPGTTQDGVPQYGT